MTDVRDLLIRIRTSDTATAVVDRLKTTMDGMRTNLDLNIDTSSIMAAQRAYEGISNSFSEPISVVTDITADIGKAQDDINKFTEVSTSFIDEAAAQMNASMSGAFSVMTDGAIDFGEATNDSVAFAQDAIEDLWREEETIIDVTDDIKNNVVPVFESFKTAADQVEQSIGRLVTSFAAMATGAAVAGVSWKDAMNSEAYTNSVLQAVDANKKFGVSSEALSDRAKKMSNEGWITSGTATKELFKTINMGGKSLGRTEEDRLSNAEAISKATFGNELLEGWTPEQLLRRFGSGGKLGKRQQQMWLSMGFDEKSAGSAKKRIQAMIDMGKNVDLEVEFKEAPWVRAEIAISKLKKSMGLAIGGSMAVLTESVASIVNLLNKIPGAPGLLGFIAVATAVLGLTGVLVSAFSPLVPVITAVYTSLLKFAVANLTAAEYETVAIASTTGHALSLSVLKAGFMNAAKAAWASILSQKAYIITTVTAGGTTTFFAGTLRILAGGFRSLAFGIYGAVRASIAFMAANAWWAFPLILAAGLILVAAKLGLFEKAWKKFSNSEFGKDVIKAFKIIQFLVNYAIGLVKIFAGVLYKKAKSGIVDTIMGIAGAIGKAYDKFDKFYSMLKGGEILDIIVGKSNDQNDPNRRIYKIILLIWEFIQNPIKSINKILEWISNLIHRLINWLIKAIPGAERSVAMADVKKMEEKEDLVYNKPEGTKGEVGYKDGFWSKKGDITKTPVDPGNKIREARAKAESLPTMFDELVSALKGFFKTLVEGIITLPEKLAKAIKSAIFGGDDEDLEKKKKNASDALTAAEDALGSVERTITDRTGHDFKWMPDPTGNGAGTLTRKGSDTPLTENEIQYLDPKVLSSLEALKAQFYKLRDVRDLKKKELDKYAEEKTPAEIPPSSNPAEIPPSSNPAEKYQSKTNPDRKISQNGYDNLPEEEKAKYQSIPVAALGGFITSAGLLLGHAGEPIVPAKIASSSVLLEKLSLLAKGSGSSTSTTDSSNHSYTINFNHYGPGEIDLKTKKEFTKLIDSYMAKTIRHRQGH